MDRKRTIPVIIFAVVAAAVPLFLLAQIVPCGRLGQSGLDSLCQFCHIFRLVQSILSFIWWDMAIPGAILLFVIAGAFIALPISSAANVQRGRRIMRWTLIGLGLSFGAWLMVDFFMKWITYNPAAFGPWNDIQCTFGEIAPPPTTAEGFSEKGFATGSCQIEPVSGLSPFQSGINAAVAQTGIDSTRLQAIIIVESSGNPSAISPAGAAGLTQLLPSTARSLNPALQGMSDSLVRQWLITHPTESIIMGATYYQQLLSRYGDPALAAAAYNGGTRANEPSVNCPGILKWQCLWDNNAHTIPNTGYAPTRQYVQSVANTAASISGGTCI